MLIQNSSSLRHPGFVLFEGLDFTGKTFIAKGAVKALAKDSRFNLKVKYLHSKELLNPNIVDSAFLKSLGPEEKVNYLLRCYSKDNLPENPEEFCEIFKDRYLPYVFFYAITCAGFKLEDLMHLAKNLLQPKHIFLFECSYQERLKRAKIRGLIETNELESLSEDAHNKLTALYREIIKATKIPYTIIDTTYLRGDKSISYFLNRLEETGILSQKVRIKNIADVYEHDIFKSTAEFKFQELLKGIYMPPIQITRRVSGKKYIDLLKKGGGRHRAYAYFKAKRKTIPAYIDYESAKSLEFKKITLIKDLKFRKNDSGKIIGGKLYFKDDN